MREETTGEMSAQFGSPFNTVASVSLTSSPSKARLSGEHLVEHAPERPHVAAFVSRPSFRLLRRHVRRRAENRAHSGHHRGRGDRRRLR